MLKKREAKALDKGIWDCKMKKSKIQQEKENFKIEIEKT
jgi:hypothetical protein